MSNPLGPKGVDPEFRELDRKIKGLVKTGSFDRITESVADFVSSKIEQYQSTKKKKGKR